MAISAELQNKRRRIHRHNSFKGFAAMGQAHMHAIQTAATTTAAAKETAHKIYMLHIQLKEQLKERVD